MTVVHLRSACLGVIAALSPPVMAQRADENAIRAAADAFGTSVGDERIGLYGGSDVRGFSAFAAGNVRLEGLYYDQQGALVAQAQSGSNIRVGLTALGYPFPAPTGIVNFALRRTGTEPVVSVRGGFGDYLGPKASIDASLPLTDRLGLNVGVSAEDSEYWDAADLWFVRAGTVARWRPVDGVELTGFFSRYNYGDEETSPQTFTAGAYLPPRFERRRFFGQDWADWKGHSQNYGTLARADLGPWHLAAGLFNSRFAQDEYAAVFFRNTQRDGTADRRVLLGRDQRSASTSGELKLSRDLREGDRLHRLIASLRAREVNDRYGGFAIIDLGRGVAGVPDPVAEPDDPVFGDLTRDRVRQRTGALGYELRWADVGELNLGVQKTRYRKSVTTPGVAPRRRSDDPWLWNASLALTMVDDLAVYAATTRGLEESGTAPTNAVNANEALPALRTRQVEAGLRYILPNDMRLLAGVFDVRKPYFEIDSDDGVFRVLGDVKHQGIELSLSGQAVEGLDVVAGAVFLRPRVTGEASEDGRLGRKPIGRTSTLLDLRLDYRIPSLDGVSVDFGILYNGRRVARADNSLHIPARALLDLGGRYRFRIGDAPATFRLQVRNLTNNHGWQVSGGGGFRPVDGRRVVATIAADF